MSPDVADITAKNHRRPRKHSKKHCPPQNAAMQWGLPLILIAGLIALLWLSVSHPASGEILDIPGEHMLAQVVGWAVFACEMFAVVVIGVAALIALLRFLKIAFRRRALVYQISDVEAIRLRMGHKLSLALEFAVAADILRLAISPSFADLLILFAVILLRILLNYFLEHDSQNIREYQYVFELQEGDKD